MPEDNFEQVPFFSVCVDITNRSKTISRVIKCIASQTCNDYELIITDHGSQDESIEIVKNILVDYPKLNKKFILESSKRTEIEEWNTPIKVARGEYIAVCEGDDYFNEEHLETAKKYLSENTNVGIYEVSSSGKTGVANGKITTMLSDEAIDKLRRMIWCPVPSAVIFRRLDDFFNPFFYNPENIYAGEYELYNRILGAKLTVVQNYSQNYIERGFNFYLKNDFHVTDAINFYEKNVNLYTLNQKKEARYRISELANLFFLWNLIRFRFNYKLFKMIVIYSDNFFLGIKPTKKNLNHIMKAECSMILSKLKRLTIA